MNKFDWKKSKILSKTNYYCIIMNNEMHVRLRNKQKK